MLIFLKNRFGYKKWNHLESFIYFSPCKDVLGAFRRCPAWDNLPTDIQPVPIWYPALLPGDVNLPLQDQAGQQKDWGAPCGVSAEYYPWVQSGHFGASSRQKKSWNFTGKSTKDSFHNHNQEITQTERDMWEASGVPLPETHRYQAGLTFRLTRKWSKYVYLYYIPSALCVLVSFNSFFIKPQVAGNNCQCS